jgi:hypothetical protein
VTNYLYTHKQRQLHTRKNERKKERNSFLEKNTAGTKTKIVFLSANKREEECKKERRPHRKRKQTNKTKQNKTKGKRRMARIFRKKERVLSNILRRKVSK